MLKLVGRLASFHKHFSTRAPICSSSIATPAVTVTPTTCLVDDKSHIRVTGLTPYQVVTLTSCVEESGVKFEGRGVYKANKDGNIDSKADPSLGGTFTGRQEDLQYKRGRRHHVFGILTETFPTSTQAVLLKLWK